jgi:hypothetical protein
MVPHAEPVHQVCCAFKGWAKGSAKSLFRHSTDGTVAQPVLITNSRRSYELVTSA